MTYYYLRTSGSRNMIVSDYERAKRKRPGYHRYFLDSGAFTLAMEAEKHSESLSSVRAYVKQYIEFVREHHELYDIIAEMDIDSLEGIDYREIEDWRRQLFAIAGKKVCIVWHPGRGAGDWEKCYRDKNVQWLGIASDVASGKLGKAMNMAAVARRAGKYVHAFGQTRVSTDMKFLKTESADSTSWLRTTKYGTTFVYKSGKLMAFNAPRDSGKKQSFRRTHKTHFEKLGLDFKKLLADDPKEVVKSGIYAWRDFALRTHTLGLTTGTSRVDFSYGGTTRSNTMAKKDVPIEAPEAPKSTPWRIPINLAADGQITIDESSTNEVTSDSDATEPTFDAAPERPKEREKGGKLGDIAARIRGQQLELSAVPQETLACAHCGERAEEALGGAFMLLPDSRTTADGRALHKRFRVTLHARCWLSIGSPEEWNDEEEKKGHDDRAISEHNRFERQAQQAATRWQDQERRIQDGTLSNSTQEKREGDNQEGGEDTSTIGDATDTSQMTHRGSGLSAVKEVSTEGSAVSSQSPDGKHHLALVTSDPQTRSHLHYDAVADAMGAMPKLACNSCAVTESCPEFREGYLCAYTGMLESLTLRNPDNVMPILVELANVQVKRALMAYAQETAAAGGMIDPRVTAQIREAMNVARELYEMTRATSPQSVPRRLVIEEHSDGSMSATATMPKGGGAISKLFGASLTTVVQDDTLDATVDAIPAYGEPTKDS